ncbi:DNA-3-methyladenine glycosylase II [Rhizoctonia solani AG-1 IB]|uniref:DNA-3-methyladenine glycosylase II n=1 Tax=Thanatephorus cucumeris (strain AG1-IB / isolate 7/3/14) TaxID=1108050 RepID=M5BUC1_THACB|nr:DNA-3-methyladenine glycosylase II [Rhizoctonia solani AG-1 IB]
MSSRVTRSATRLRSTITGTPAIPIVELATLPRRKKATASGRSGSPTPSKRPAPYSKKVAGPAVELPDLPPFIEPPYDPVLIPAALTFSFGQAKEHLIKVDSRFDKIFRELPCRPFEHLEPVDPFQTLVTSILGQQISWLAAKSIRHRFLRLFDRSLPEKASLNYEQGLKYTFPSPGRIASLDEGILRTAGLSGRKAEYVLDLANRFADGRLSTQKLANATDEELSEMLIAVRGIGKWTVDMFAIFSLRRPDILPIGDLGVQKGLLNWVLSSHDPEKYPLCVNPRKLPQTNDDEPEKPEEAKAAEPGEDTSVLPAPTEASTSKSTAPAPAPKASSSKQPDGIPLVPTEPVPLPEGITLEILKARANGKKAKGGCYLLPGEMEALTASWKPYRSLEPIATGNKIVETEPTVASPRSSSSSVVHALNTSKSTTTSTTSVDTPRDGDSPRPSTTPKETDTIKDTEDEFQDLSLDDTEAADPRFSTVPLYTPSVKSRPLDSPDQSKPGSLASRRRSTSVTSPITPVTALKQSRRKTIASGSSAGNLPLLLARLEQKSAKEDADPSLKRASVDGTSKLVDGFKKIHDKSEGDVAGAVDWGFWGEVVANYEEVARTRPTELAQAIENGIPASLRGMMWQLMCVGEQRHDT